jgi:glycosyltransferase involved in cell wall biosynthesis
MEKIKLLTTVAIVDVNRDGVSVSVAGLTKSLSSLGIPIEVITAGKLDGLEIPRSQIFNLSAIDVQSLRIYFALKFGPQVRSRIENFKPDIIHDHGLWGQTNWSSTSIALRRKIPLVISTRGTLSPWALKYKGLRKRIAWKCFQQSILQAAGLLHSTSYKEAEDLRKLGLKTPIAVIPNALELPVENLFPKIISTSSSEKVALFLSRIHPVKGLLDLMQAWSAVRPPGWRMLVVGRDENGFLSEVQQVTNSLGLSDIVEFIGPVDSKKKWDYYRRANLFILPSYSENFGLVIAEALACGVPVITTTGTPWKEIKDWQCGWWIEPGVNTLTEVLTQATSMPFIDLCQMGQRGANLIKSKYQWDAAAMKMIQAYQWVLGRGTRPEFIV